MPVGLQTEGFISARGEGLETSDVVLSRSTLDVIDGTMRFNQRQGPQVFETT